MAGSCVISESQTITTGTIRTSSLIEAWRSWRPFLGLLAHYASLPSLCVSSLIMRLLPHYASPPSLRRLHHSRRSHGCRNAVYIGVWYWLIVYQRAQAVLRLIVSLQYAECSLLRACGRGLHPRRPATKTIIRYSAPVFPADDGIHSFYKQVLEYRPHTY
jgi:hypothetical protein